MSALALDRQAIEKKDFPISRRGYEPEAVDVHLAALAGEVERLERETERAQRAAATAGAQSTAPAASPAQSLALAASEQVRLIVDAAESSAADIERIAEEEAARIRADADAEARRTREEAVGRSQDHVGQVGEATSAMLQRMDAMESELGSLLDGLRTGTSRLTADLSLLQGNLGDLYGAAGSAQAPAPPRTETRRAAEPEPVPAPAPVPVAEAPEPEPVATPEAEEEPGAVAPAASAAVPEPPVATEAPAPAASSGGDGDVEGARLIALNMALNGQSREETGKYLEESFDLADRDALLDEVYATVEG